MLDLVFNPAPPPSTEDFGIHSDIRCNMFTQKCPIDLLSEFSLSSSGSTESVCAVTQVEVV
jgi:hypothetical protein